MWIEAFAEALNWSEEITLLDEARSAYVDVLRNRLTCLLAFEARSRPDSNRPATRIVSELTDRELSHWLTEPETAFRILWSRDSPDALFGYIEESIAAAIKATMPKHPLPGGLSVEFGGPSGSVHACAPVYPAGEFDEEEKERLLRLLVSALARVRDAAPSAHQFVTRITRVLLLVKDPASAGFSSSTSDRYIGRSVFRNGHKQDVNEVYIAEGLVHESIHTFLDMDETVRDYSSDREPQWVRDPELRQPVPFAISPWTGNKLSLRSYLQACFVWYGVLLFFSRSFTRKIMQPQCVRQRISQAASGFLGEALISPLVEHRSQLAPDLLRAIDNMQARIRECFDAVVKPA